MGKNKSTGRANDAFQRCGRLEQLLTEYCNHYVSIRRAVRISANRARLPPRRVQKNDRPGVDNRLAVADRKSFAERRQSNRFHVKLDFNFPPPPRRGSSPLLPRNHPRHAKRRQPPRPVTDSSVDARLYSFLPFPVGSICFAISIQPRCILDGDADNRTPVQHRFRLRCVSRGDEIFFRSFSPIDFPPLSPSLFFICLRINFRFGNRPVFENVWKSRMIIHVASAIGKDLEEKMRIEIEEICWFVCSFV